MARVNLTVTVSVRIPSRVVSTPSLALVVVASAMAMVTVSGATLLVSTIVRYLVMTVRHVSVGLVREFRGSEALLVCVVKALSRVLL